MRKNLLLFFMKFTHTSLLLLIVFTLCASLNAQTVPTQPDHSWLFDDGSGTTATANTGGVDGSLGANVSFSTTTFDGGSGNSLDFSGTTGSENNFNSGDIVDFSALDNAFNGNGELSMSFWIKADSTGADQAWFSMSKDSNKNGGGSEEDRFDLRYDSAVFNGSNNNTITASFGSDAETNPDDHVFYGADGHQTTNWQHVAFTFNGSSSVGDRYKLYVDGVQDTNPDSISTMNEDPSTVGVGSMVADQVRFMLGEGAKDPWKGFIDESALWESELTSSEVQWLADSSNNLTAIPEPSAYAALLSLVSFGFVLMRHRK